MHVRIVAFALLGLALMAGFGVGPDTVARHGPDQPVRPQVPVLVPACCRSNRCRSRPCSSRRRPPFTLTPRGRDRGRSRIGPMGRAQPRHQDVRLLSSSVGFTTLFSAPSRPAEVHRHGRRSSMPRRIADCSASRRPRRTARTCRSKTARAEHWISDGKSIFEYSPGEEAVDRAQVAAGIARQGDCRQSAAVPLRGRGPEAQAAVLDSSDHRRPT